MLEGLTIIIIAATIVGIVTSVASKGDEFIMTSGIMFATFGVTALFWTARAVTPHLQGDSSIEWLYKPISALPEWVGYVGSAATIILWVVAVTFLVDDFVHLRRRKGGRH